MIEIGKLNQLTITRLDAGVYLDGAELGELFLPFKEAQENPQIGDTVEVFVYKAAKGKLSVTTHTPKAFVNQIAWLKVLEIGRVGAFLDWGLSKDLLVPFVQQRGDMEVGKHYLVKLFLDDQQRMTATMRFESSIMDAAYYLKDGDKVSIVIVEKTDLGFKTIVNDSYWGVLYQNEVFQPVRKGLRLDAFVKKIREDNKIDLSLQNTATHVQASNLTDRILAKLQAENGSLDLGDKSAPEDIYRMFGVSKKVFKQALGSLYKQKLIQVDKHSIQVLKSQ